MDITEKLQRLGEYERVVANFEARAENNIRQIRAEVATARAKLSAYRQALIEQERDATNQTTGAAN